MKFKQATDALLESLTLEDLAKEIGVSIQSARQARADEKSTAYRNPPEGWERAVSKLAEDRAKKLTSLARRMGRS